MPWRGPATPRTEVERPRRHPLLPPRPRSFSSGPFSSAGTGRVSDGRARFRGLAQAPVGHAVATADGLAALAGAHRDAGAGLIRGSTHGRAFIHADRVRVTRESEQTTARGGLPCARAGREDRHAVRRGFTSVAVGHAVAAADRVVLARARLRRGTAGSREIGTFAGRFGAVVAIFAVVAGQTRDASAG